MALDRIWLTGVGGKWGENTYRLWNRRALTFSPANKYTSFNIWDNYSVWNFKGYFWNSTQNDILPIHWNAYFIQYWKARNRFWTQPPTPKKSQDFMINFRVLPYCLCATIILSELIILKFIANTWKTKLEPHRVSSPGDDSSFKAMLFEYPIAWTKRLSCKAYYFYCLNSIP